MASLSIARPVRNGAAGSRHAPAAEPGGRKVLRVQIDARGIIQSFEGEWPTTRAVVAGASYFDLLDQICETNPIRAEAVRSGIRSLWTGHAESFSLEFACASAEGEMRVNLAAAVDRDASSRSVWITHAEAANEDPQEYKMEALGRLASGVAHDFANLVTTISGYSDLLLNRLDPDDPSRPELEEIRKAAARGASVTSQILDFVRKKAVLPAGVQLNALVTEMLRMLSPLLGEHIQRTVKLDPRLGVVNAEFAQMSRVLMNLILNARDAMPRGGTITIRTANLHLRVDSWRGLPPGRYVMLEVADTGPGMDAETLRHIFRPFFTTKGRAGTGLGLNTVRRIVHQAGGHVWVRSRVGEGSTFTVCLPRAEGSAAIADADSAARPVAAGTETILLAEDEESVRKLLRHILDANGYRVLEAADGSEALRLFNENAADIDLLLTDVIMPGMNGRDLFQNAHALKPDLKVIYMSGYTEDVLLNTGISGPGASFLRKPLKLDELTATIRQLLDTSVIQ